MGRKCCVPGCETNYKAEASVPGSCFRFPSNEKRKEEWKKMIPRDDTFNSEYAGVCILHFERKYIKTHNERGKVLMKPRLTVDAIPTVFTVSVDGVPEIFSCANDENDLISHFNNLKNNYSDHITFSNNWSTSFSEFYISFYKLKRSSDGKLIVETSINVDRYLNIKVFFENKLMNMDSFYDILPRHRHLTLFSQLNRIVKKCDGKIDGLDNSITNYLENALSQVTAAIVLIESCNDYQYTNCVNMIHDQLVQLTSNRRRYSVNTIMNAYTVQIQSSKTYNLIIDSKMLLLPSKRTLQRISRYQDVNPNSSSSNLSYIQKVASNLSIREKYVILQIDEIYSNPQVNYWNELTGFAENKDEVATTVLGVLVSSCFGRMKEVVHLIPTKDPTGIDLKRYILDVTQSLQSLGLIVLALVTDNNRVNQNVFSLLAPDGSFSFQNAMHPDRKIQLIYDSLHVFKNIRSNWVNKRDDEKSFFYPNFNDFSIIQQATFNDLRVLYHSEKHKMIKKAPKLNMKSLYPTTFDRQKVSLALNLIHPTTIAALSTLDDTDTAEFLEVISMWFTIMNNRSTLKGRKELNILAEPIKSSSEYQVEMLKKFVKWLKAWQDIEKDLHLGGLTKDTFQAAIVSTNGVIQLIVESFISCDIEYFLPGKIQTNDIEKRFGRYRELSGCNYNVSVKQILEAEKKLRIKRLISTFPKELKSSRYNVKKEKYNDISEFIDLVSTDYLQHFQSYEHSSFMYVCGYGGFTIMGKTSCHLCRDLIIKSKGTTTQTDYFDYLQRGGLVVPTENCLSLLLHMSALFEELKRDTDKRRKFQFSNNPRNILVLLTIQAISQSDNFVVDWDDTCLCGKTYIDLFTPLLSVYANILLNNYRKKINDFTILRKLGKSQARKKRKIETSPNLTQPKKTKFSTASTRKASIYNKIS